MSSSEAAPMAVMLHGCKSFGSEDCHESATQTVLAERLAALCGLHFVGEHAGAQHAGPATYAYLVPARTLALDEARELGVQSEDDLFGGVVPHVFVGSKCISHSLPDGATVTGGETALGTASTANVAPDGWVPAFGNRVRDHVLPGYSAFTSHHALLAGQRLLADGPVRVKPGWGIGGNGQFVARDAQELEAAIARLDGDQLARYGVVLEWHLESVRTMSVGQVTVAGLQTAYCGIQGLTRNSNGEAVYGGSDLMFVRGGFDALLAPEFVAALVKTFGRALDLHVDSDPSDVASMTQQGAADLTSSVRSAIEAAGAYHAAALECFSGFFASRCNYDVLIGIDAKGRILTGVLEQSWRMGGASGAEVAALEAFACDPTLTTVCASTYERYGDGVEVPTDATVYFQGVDRQLGPFSKYARLHADCSRIPDR